MQIKCTTCQVLKNHNNFPLTKGRNGKYYYRHKCKLCTSKYYCDKLYVQHKALYVCQTKICSICRIEKEASHENFHSRKGSKGFYFIGRCKECVRHYQNTYKTIRNKKTSWRRKIDPQFKLRQYVSNSIKDHLIKCGSSKKNNSIVKFLPYSITQLKKHLELLFEPWMNWSNHGIYDLKTWNDSDQSTWKWQLDHIIPHSNFKYQSMTDPLFLQCWDLFNLRPLSAKQNILDKNRKIP